MRRSILRALPLAGGALSSLLLVLTAPMPLAAQTGRTPLLNVADHQLEQGDLLLVQLFDGEEQFEYTAQVDSAGEVMLPLLGMTPARGLRPRELAEQLTAGFSRFYVHPSIAVQLLSLGQFDVFVFGPDFPGRIYSLDNGSRLSDLLEQIIGEEETKLAAQTQQGGLSQQAQPSGAMEQQLPPVKTEQGKPTLSQRGRYRRISVIRGGFDFALVASGGAQSNSSSSGTVEALITSSTPAQRRTGSLASFTNWRPWIEARKSDPNSKVWVIDPLRITLEGELSSTNLLLQDKDVVYVPSPEQFVDVTGVALEGRYELLGGENLGDVLRLAGSVDYPSDLANAVVQRFDNRGRVQRIIVNLYPALDDLTVIERFELKNRDRISIVKLESRVFVLGEVKSAGASPFEEDSTVLDYLALAGGETPDANLAWIAIIRQSRDRLHPYEGAEVIQVNFKEIHKGLPYCEDVNLLPGDVIYVPPKGYEFKPTEILQAAGTALTAYSLARKTK